MEKWTNIEKLANASAGQIADVLTVSALQAEDIKKGARIAAQTAAAHTHAPPDITNAYTAHLAALALKQNTEPSAAEKAPPYRSEKPQK